MVHVLHIHLTSTDLLKWDCRSTLKLASADGFHLNGRRLQLYGVCLHHDHGPLGAAFFPRAMERLHKRYRRLIERGKTPNLVAVAVARELAGFIWALLREGSSRTRPPATAAAVPSAATKDATRRVRAGSGVRR